MPMELTPPQVPHLHYEAWIETWANYMQTSSLLVKHVETEIPVGENEHYS